jgi:hypothetical protein
VYQSLDYSNILIVELVIGGQSTRIRKSWVALTILCPWNFISQWLEKDIKRLPSCNILSLNRNKIIAAKI